ncbi:MAG TPA: hypothetical protein VKF63_13015 [Terracidiphilus sp.]|nr:hypothetical protein [Terracidiphilus sp.]
MRRWTIGGIALFALLNCSIASAQATPAAYKVTVKQVTTSDTFTFNGLQRNRSYQASNGKVFLIVDLTIKLSDLKSGSQFVGKSILNMVTVTNNIGEVFIASGGGYDPDHTCSGDHCVVFISKFTPPADTPNSKGETAVLFGGDPQLEFKYFPANILFDGRLVFLIPKELAGMPLKLQFQGIQLSVQSN